MIWSDGQIPAALMITLESVAMTEAADKARARVRKEVMSEPDIWFDLRYCIKYNSKKGAFEFKHIYKVRSTNKSEDGK